MFLTRLWSCICSENNLKNDFPCTFINDKGWKLPIVKGSGGTFWGMKTSEARCHWFETVER